MLPELLDATKETLLLIIVPGAIALIIGLPMALALCAFSEKNKLYPNKFLYKSLLFIMSSIQSIPFLVFLVALFPLLHLLIKQESFIFSGIIPLSLAAIPIFTLELYKAFDKLPNHLSDIGKVFGATPYQALTQIYLPEAFPGIVQALTTTLTHLIGFSTIAGIIGAGGLGELIIQRGLRDFDFNYVLSVVVLLIAFTKLIQALGQKLYLAAAK